MRPLCVHRFASIGSTSAEAMRLLRDGAPDGTVIWAGEQTAGRGRMGRGWESPPGNLYLSVLARVDLPAALSGRIAVTCGRTLAAALREMTRLPVATKWPNDLYLRGRKVGGILVETRLGAGGTVEGVVVGVGLNVATHPDVPPPGAAATHLAAHGIRADAAPDLFAPIAAGTWAACHDVTRPDWLQLIGLSDVLELAAGPVRVRSGGGEFDAVAEGLGEDGALIVRRQGIPVRLTDAEVSVRALGADAHGREP